MLAEENKRASNNIVSDSPYNNTRIFNPFTANMTDGNGTYGILRHLCPYMGMSVIMAAKGLK